MPEMDPGVLALGMSGRALAANRSVARNGASTPDVTNASTIRCTSRTCINSSAADGMGYENYFNQKSYHQLTPGDLNPARRPSTGSSGVPRPKNRSFVGATGTRG